MAWRMKAGRTFASITLLALPVAAACSGSPSPTAGSGDDFTDDARDAEARPPANPTPADAGDEAGTGPVYGADGGASYPGTSECGGCTCAASKGYCFGGATPRQAIAPFASPDAGGGAGDGGLPACVMIDAGASTAPQLGCNPLPASCTDCACILSLLQPAYSCYLVCAADAVGKPMTVYCPNE